MLSPLATLHATNHAYEAVHTCKEDAFWTALMGLSGGGADVARAKEEAEIAWSRFLQEPERLATIERATARAEAEHADDATLVALRGWRTTLRAHALASVEARALSEEIVAAEGQLADARREMVTGFESGSGLVPASSVKLAVMVRSEPDPALREAAWRGLRAIEDYVLAHGFLDVVRKRNALARLHGAPNFYAWKVQRTEQLSIEQIFALLDDLEVRTRSAAQRFLDELAARHAQGAETRAAALHPWDIHYLVTGASVAEQDPYFSFGDAVDRWGRSFAAMGIDYRGARLVLDLVDRPGKYENGFMHGPEVAWRDGEELHRARIHFTSNAIPGMTGAGKRAMATLFHEGGHAAHFANIDMPAPCFGQEFAPTSAAFCETQSMFLDSLLDDADWLMRYARDADGAPMPLALIEAGIRAAQPIEAWEKRAWLAICYGERAIYELADDELTAERVLSTLRTVEARMMLLPEGSVRPVLSVPHLLSGESSAYYHAYVLAEMAVQQTRDHFLSRDGHIVDNPRVGPELRDAYWRPGNSRPFFDYVLALTGVSLSAAALARSVTMTAEQAVEEARAAVAREPSLPRHRGPVALDADVRIMHGDALIAELGADWAEFAGAFRRWVDNLAKTIDAPGA